MSGTLFWVEQVFSCTENQPSLHFPLGCTPTPTNLSWARTPLLPLISSPTLSSPLPVAFRPRPFKIRPRGPFDPAPCLPPPTQDPAPLCSAPRATSTSSPTRKGAPPTPRVLAYRAARPRAPPAPHSAARAAASAPPAAILRRLPPPSASAPPSAPPALKVQAGTPPVLLGKTRPTWPFLL